MENSEPETKQRLLSPRWRWALLILSILLAALGVAILLPATKHDDPFISPLAIGDDGMFWLVRHFPGIITGTYQVTAMGALPVYTFTAEYQLRQGGAIVASQAISISLANMTGFDGDPAWTTRPPIWSDMAFAGEAEEWCRVSWSTNGNQFNDPFLEYGVCVYGDEISPPDADHFHYLRNVTAQIEILFPMIFRYFPDG